MSIDKWHPASEAPDNAWPLALGCTMLCDCEKGGRIVITGARKDGEWWFVCEHEVKVTHWMRLPKLPSH